MDAKKSLCSLECCPRIANYESLRYYQSKQDTLHHTDMLQAIADSMEDITQTEDVTV